MGRNTSYILGGSVLAVALSVFLATPMQDKPVFPNAGIGLGLDLQGGAELLFAPDWSSIPDARERKRLQEDPKTLDIIVETTRQRIDIFGLKEIGIRRTDSGRIRVELPGLDEAEAKRIKKLIVKAGNLHFRLVAPAKLQERYKRPEKPDGYEWFPHRNPAGGPPTEWDLLQIDDKYKVTGQDLKSAAVGPGRFGGNKVNFTIRRRSQTKFGNLTGDNLGTAMAIVLDGQIQSAPTIKGKITDQGYIEAGGDAGFSQEEAQDLVTVLKSGSLPVALRAESQNVVGPGLGADAIQAGIVAGVVGTVAVVLVMIVYYFGMGVLATIGLGVAMALVVGVLAAFNATLTLSGIAGLVLTLGMAVDANVLIYERIREELARGLSTLEAINEGFDRATETILDANITTLLTAFILYLVGEGPVQGFAITLSAGIIASVLASLLTTRALFTYFAERGALRELKMLNLIGQPSWRYTKAIGACLVASSVLIVGGLVLFVQRGMDNYGLDFRAGTLVQFSLKEPAPIDEIRTALAGFTAKDGKSHPYADAEIVSIYRTMADATGDTNEFQLRTDEQQTDPSGPDIATVIRDDIIAVFGDRLAAQGFGVTQTTIEGLSWNQVYGLRVEQRPGDVKRAVEKAVRFFTEKGGTLEGVMITVDVHPKDQKAERVDRIQVVMEKQPLAGGRDKAWYEKFLKEQLARKVHKYLDEEQLSPAHLDDIVREGAVTVAETHRLPVTFRAPVAEAKVDRVLYEDENYAKTEVTVEVAEADKLPPLEGAVADEAGPRMRAATFVVTGQTGASGLLEQLKHDLREGFGESQILLSDPFPRMQNILPTVAVELRRKGFTALIMAAFVILIYVWLRFRASAAPAAAQVTGFLGLLRDFVYQARFGIAAIVAIFHDVLFALGAIAAVDHFGLIDAKIDLPMLAALLAIIGYSLNDSIVVFDRVRENLRKTPDMPLRDLIDLSVNQMMSRTLLTSLTTLVAVLALMIFGADSTRGFAFAMFVGVTVGTYSSIFIASPLLLLWEKGKPGDEKGGGTPEPAPAAAT